MISSAPRCDELPGRDKLSHGFAGSAACVEPTWGSAGGNLAKEPRDIRNLPGLNDQAIAEMREHDLVDLKGSSGGRDPGEILNEGAGHYDTGHRS